MFETGIKLPGFEFPASKKPRFPLPALPMPVLVLPECQRRVFLFLAALEPHREIIGYGIHRDPLLCHGVALTHRDGVVLE